MALQMLKFRKKQKKKLSKRSRKFEKLTKSFTLKLSNEEQEQESQLKQEHTAASEGGRESVDMEKDEFVERGGGGSDKGLKKPL